MGEAKQRGSREERAANPKGDSWRVEYWTPERKAEFHRRLTEDLGKMVDGFKKSLFGSTPKKKKRFKKIKTGG